jgi:glycosyltransferase involved in cell wall biosynthesis
MRILSRIATPVIRTWLRHVFVPPSLPKAARHLNEVINKYEPELLHAMRVPYEGMITALAVSNPKTPKIPLLLSIWGNDFSLHAPANQQMAALTHQTMTIADALHTDCFRDQTYARAWGFGSNKPAIVLPGAGGIQLDVFYPQDEREPTVINPRGLRTYVRNDTFFKAIPLVLDRHQGVKFICPNMHGRPEALGWIENLGIQDAVDLLPPQSRSKMADLYRQAQIAISPSIHDGTPNSLLEAMACGCFPIAGDIESIREWITPGGNGFLINPDDPEDLASAILDALGNPELRTKAMEANAAIIRERAEYTSVMERAEEFYRQLIAW